MAHPETARTDQSADAVSARIEESLTDAIRRITLSRYDVLFEALSHLTDTDTDIHTARKAMKRIRALLRLDREEHRRDAYRRENATLRDVARRIASVRDSLVLTTTFEDVVRTFPGEHEESLDIMREHLKANHRDTREAVRDDENLRSDILLELSAAHHRLSLMPPIGEGRDITISDFAMIETGLHRTYRSGRRALRRATSSNDVGVFHRWRKPVKYGRHQIELLVNYQPEIIEPLVERMSALGDILGFVQDLDVLDAVVRANPGTIPDERTERLVLTSIDDQRTRRQSEALRLGISLYEDTPDAFVTRLRHCWVEGRNRQN